MAIRAARRIALVLAVVALALSAGLAAPSPASACVGCDTTFREFVDGSPSIVLASYRGRVGSHVVFDVIDVLKGPALRTVRFEPTDFSPGPRPWGRWLLAPAGDLPVGGVMDGGLMVEGFRVSAGGTVTNTLPGEGAVNVYPHTLAGWYRALGLRLPDTATAPVAAPPAPLRAPVVLLAGAGLLGALLALRRAPTPHRRAKA